MTVNKVVEGVATALGAVVPEGLSVRGAAGCVYVTTPLGTDVFPLAINIQSRLDSGIPANDAVRGAVLRLLDELQDSVTVLLTEPWPSLSDSNRDEFAQPHAEVREGVLYLWFGDAAPATPMGRVVLD